MAGPAQYASLELAYSSTVASNAITITLTPSRSQNAITVYSVRLGNTTGTGLNETLKIEAGSDEVWAEGFTVGTDKALGNSLPVAGRPNENVVITAQADNLTAGYVSVSYTEAPA